LAVASALTFVPIVHVSGAPVVAAGPIDARGSVNQVYATGLAPGASVSLVRADATIATQQVNPLGGVLFRDVLEGAGYVVRSGNDESAPLTVHDDTPEPWDTSFYDDQTIDPDGYQYITTRDGTQLALTVHPPTSPAGIIDIPGLPAVPLPDALLDLLPISWAPPYPTLIEYSGYATADPVPGQVVPNGAIVRLSDAGELCVFTKAAAHALVDVAGYVPAGAAGIRTIAPSRLVDSRDGARLGPTDMVEIQVAGWAGVPATADAALLNVAVIEPDDAGYITLWLCGPRPRTSNLNHAPGTLVRANNALTQLSPDGTICAFSRTAADIVVDVTGWLEPTAP
jgi:hypothetical protein